jgi:hypothetical protein
LLSSHQIVQKSGAVRKAASAEKTENEIHPRRRAESVNSDTDALVKRFSSPEGKAQLAEVLTVMGLGGHFVATFDREDDPFIEVQTITLGAATVPGRFIVWLTPNSEFRMLEDHKVSAVE